MSEQPYVPGSFDFRQRPVNKAEKKPNEWLEDVGALFRAAKEPPPEYTGPCVWKQRYLDRQKMRGERHATISE